MPPEPVSLAADLAESRWRTRWRARRRRVAEVWIAGVLASLVVTGASALGYLEGLQTRTLDLLQRLGARQPPGGVVLVAIDEAAFRGLGFRQPIPRAYLARVIDGLRRAGAAVVGLDVVLSAPTTPAEDGELARALLTFARDGRSRVVPVDAPPLGSGPLADPALLRALVRGSDRMPVDGDGVVRRVAPLVPRPDGGATPALALALLGHVLPPAANGGRERDADLGAYPRWRPDGTWALRGEGAALRAGDLWRINFLGPPGSFLTIGSDDVARLGDPAVGDDAVAEDNPLRGRLALVGGTFADSRDAYPTPVGRLPGVEVHATVAHMLATRTLLRPAGWRASASSWPWCSWPASCSSGWGRSAGRCSPCCWPWWSGCPPATWRSTAAATRWTSSCPSSPPGSPGSGPRSWRAGASATPSAATSAAR
jgi:CHASE2 domain-containing sensor protein